MKPHIFDTTKLAEFSAEKMKKVNLFESPNLFCDIYCLKPGQSQKAHTHGKNDKIYYAIEGTCNVQIGEDTLPLPPGQVAIAPAGMVHGVTNNSQENTKLLVIMAPNPND